MEIFITFDYELFFGSSTGTAEKCMLQPTKRLIDIASKHNAKFTFFVDVLYLMKLESYSYLQSHRKAVEAIKMQVSELIKGGHDVQLHLHTHWLNAVYQNKWVLNYKEYRIHYFKKEEINRIVQDSTQYLENITKKKIFAFRAGGWCLQPFNQIHQALLNSRIWLDSTVFFKGFNDSPTNFYDFRQAPDWDIWNFDKDPLQAEPHGFFTELPISSLRVSPVFYWKLAFLNKFLAENHQTSGDGCGIPNTKLQLLRLLLTPTYSVISCDGYKASLMEAALKAYSKRGRNKFVVIGHPKLMTNYSFNKLDEFIEQSKDKGHTFSSLEHAFCRQKDIESLPIT